jgi:hypothetical protein
MRHRGVERDDRAVLAEDVADEGHALELEDVAGLDLADGTQLFTPRASSSRRAGLVERLGGERRAFAVAHLLADLRAGIPEDAVIERRLGGREGEQDEDEEWHRMLPVSVAHAGFV